LRYCRQPPVHVGQGRIGDALHALHQRDIDRHPAPVDFLIQQEHPALESVADRRQGPRHRPLRFHILFTVCV
jgi:hypothetical protein